MNIFVVPVTLERNLKNPLLSTVKVGDDEVTVDTMSWLSTVQGIYIPAGTVLPDMARWEFVKWSNPLKEAYVALSISLSAHNAKARTEKEKAEILLNFDAQEKKILEQVASNTEALTLKQGILIHADPDMNIGDEVSSRLGL